MDRYIFYLKATRTIDKVILSLKADFFLEKEKDMASFLGLNITRDRENKTLAMTQTGLIERILLL